MNVHNLMEEYVAERVEETYNQLNKKRPGWLVCDCESCRLDVTSYVLNKVHPHYIVSGRGALYTAQKLVDKQLSEKLQQHYVLTTKSLQFRQFLEIKKKKPLLSTSL